MLTTDMNQAAFLQLQETLRKNAQALARVGHWVAEVERLARQVTEFERKILARDGGPNPSVTLRTGSTLTSIIDVIAELKIALVELDLAREAAK